MSPRHKELRDSGVLLVPKQINLFIKHRSCHHKGTNQLGRSFYAICRLRPLNTNGKIRQCQLLVIICTENFQKIQLHIIIIGGYN